MFERFKRRAKRWQQTRRDDAMLRRLTDRALKVMSLADEEARQAHYRYLGTEHLLLGLLLPPNIAAAYRRSSNAEARWFATIALGLLRELQYGFAFAMELGVLKAEECEKLTNLAGRIDTELAAFHAAMSKPRDS
jgi:hypothetical protein